MKIAVLKQVQTELSLDKEIFAAGIGHFHMGATRETSQKLTHFADELIGLARRDFIQASKLSTSYYGFKR